LHLHDAGRFLEACKQAGKPGFPAKALASSQLDPGPAAGCGLATGAATLSGHAGGVLAAFVLVNLCATGSWVSAYPTFSEIFPTALRSTGIGFSVAFGRIGAGLAPLMLVTVAQQSSVMTSFVVLAGFYLLGAGVMVPRILRGPEGRGKALELLSTESMTS